MGNSALIDIASAQYWLFIALAVLVLSVSARSLWSSVCLACLNLGFCVMIVGWYAAMLVGIALTCLHFVCKLDSSRARLTCIAGCGVALGATFLLHKTPTQADGAVASFQVALTTVGFSYLFLRVVEYLRGGANGITRHLSMSDTVNYLIPAHMLAAGPVVALADFSKQPAPVANVSREDVISAFERIARGLFKKFVLANGLVETVFLTDFRLGGSYFLLEAQMYYLFIYLDFSAYSDIAVGVGKLLGVATPENFDRPLGARNIVIFWERWHISLSQFIRRNLFIPVQLAGMRYTQGHFARTTTSAAFLVAFTLCGLWHGLSWRFVVWGCMHALALITCNFYREWLNGRLGRDAARTFSQLPIVRFISTALTFEFVAFSLAFLAHPALEKLG